MKTGPIAGIIHGSDCKILIDGCMLFVAEEIKLRTHGRGITLSCIVELCYRDLFIYFRVSLVDM